MAMIGTNEMESNTIGLKNLETGDQQKLSLEELISFLK